MNDYDPLRDYLKQQTLPEFVLSFEKIEEIIFACAMELVTDVEQRITIRYPFMPRPGDPITSSDGAESKVIARKIEKEGKDGFLMVLARETGSSKEWSTRFELP